MLITSEPHDKKTSHISQTNAALPNPSHIDIILMRKYVYSISCLLAPIVHKNLKLPHNQAGIITEEY
jgi:hypothetical protein